MVNIFKYLARKILHFEIAGLREQIAFFSERMAIDQQEIKDLTKQVKELQSRLNGETVLLPASLLKELMEILPSANNFTGLKRETEHLRAIGISDIQITIRNKLANAKFEIKRKHHTIKYNMFGVVSEIDTNYWDISNIKVLADSDFEVIGQCLTA